eukprot:TRINITY_DN5848_c0_g1_i2.p2 TRINITY_DN5848_c0_g1~~TRINITY_DN5848_c0_g1_i2.p2  ORF type:complete len:332 (+),score=96.51 TRINITY_DN5848_c0_g1_i2:1124-2119(+)
MFKKLPECVFAIFQFLSTLTSDYRVFPDILIVLCRHLDLDARCMDMVIPITDNLRCVSPKNFLRLIGLLDRKKKLISIFSPAFPHFMEIAFSEELWEDPKMTKIAFSTFAEGVFAEFSENFESVEIRERLNDLAIRYIKRCKIDKSLPTALAYVREMALHGMIRSQELVDTIRDEVLADEVDSDIYFVLTTLEAIVTSGWHLSVQDLSVIHRRSVQLVNQEARLITACGTLYFGMCHHQAQDVEKFHHGEKDVFFKLMAKDYLSSSERSLRKIAHGAILLLRACREASDEMHQWKCKVFEKWAQKNPKVLSQLDEMDKKELQVLVNIEHPN